MWQGRGGSRRLRGEGVGGRVAAAREWWERSTAELKRRVVDTLARRPCVACSAWGGVQGGGFPANPRRERGRGPERHTAETGYRAAHAHMDRIAAMGDPSMIGGCLSAGWAATERARSWRGRGKPARGSGEATSEQRAAGSSVSFVGVLYPPTHRDGACVRRAKVAACASRLPPLPPAATLRRGMRARPQQCRA